MQGNRKSIEVRTHFLRIFPGKSSEIKLSQLYHRKGVDSKVFALPKLSK